MCPLWQMGGMMRNERHTGRVGDIFLVEDPEMVMSRQGNCKNTQVQRGDRMMRVRHSGDCFSDYVVLRKGRVIGEWRGYDFADFATARNVVDEIVAGRLPLDEWEILLSLERLQARQGAT